MIVVIFYGEPKFGKVNEESSDARDIVAGSVTLGGDGEEDKGDGE